MKDFVKFFAQLRVHLIHEYVENMQFAHSKLGVHLIHECVFFSRQYGMPTEEHTRDTNERKVFLATTGDFWGAWKGRTFWGFFWEKKLGLRVPSADTGAKYCMPELSSVANVYSIPQLSFQLCFALE